MRKTQDGRGYETSLRKMPLDIADSDMGEETEVSGTTVLRSKTADSNLKFLNAEFESGRLRHFKGGLHYMRENQRGGGSSSLRMRRAAKS